MCHSYFSFISPDEFFATHPEYFSEMADSRDKDTQLCLTNPDVLKIVTERMLKRMAEDPGAEQYNFSQMDYYNYCECAECAKVNEQYDTLGGTQFWFVNKLAEQTAAVYPNKLIGTLAYMYTRNRPKDSKFIECGVVMPHVSLVQSHPSRRASGTSTSSGARWHVATLLTPLRLYYIVDFAHYYNPFPTSAPWPPTSGSSAISALKAVFEEGTPTTAASSACYGRTSG